MKFTRRDALIAFPCIVATATVMAWAQPTESPIFSRVFHWADLKATPTAAGERRAVFNSPTPTLANLSLHITTLNPGQAPHPPHRHPEEEIMIVREGTVEALQENRTNLVTAGGIIFEASNELHGLRNVGTNPANYYVIKFVRRDLKK